MKTIKITTTIFLLCIGTLCAQSKYSTKTGSITFEASVPSFEEVKATHTNVSAILKADTGDFASLALIKGFRFKVALMEEHFNENYMESSTYPKAVCKGKLQNFDAASITNEFSEYVLKGTITMHGETKNIETPIQLRRGDNGLEMKSSFILKPGDFNIEIPKIVSSKIADEVTVTAMYSLSN